MAERTIRIILSGDSAGAVRAMVQTGTAAEGLQGKLDAVHAAGLRMSSIGRSMTAFAVPFVALGGFALKAAANFQSSMEQIHTQAGGSQADVATMSRAVLGMAGPLATAPLALADSAYHAFSATKNMADSLGIMSAAAKEAKISGADLTDTTTALTASVFSGIKGAQDFTSAMGILNATVGAGDMHFQDLNEAFAGPMLATVKGYGLSLRDVGAALATMGDLNIRGAEAATQLRMAVQYMAKPAKTAGGLLAQMGLTTKSFADAMAHGGLMPALELLHNGLDRIGVKGNQMANVIGDLFTKKGASGVVILENALSRLHSKFNDVGAGATQQGAAWTAYTHTAAYQFDKLKSTVKTAMIGIGAALMPIAVHWLPKIVTAVKDAAHWFEHLSPTVKNIIVGFVAFMAIGGPILMFLGSLVTAIGALGGALMFLWANPVFLIIGGLIAFGAALVLLYHRVGWFRDFVNGAFNTIKDVVTTVIGFIRQHWALLAEILAAPFTFGLSLIITHFGQIGNFIAGIFNGIKGIVVDVLNWIIGKLNWFIDQYNSIAGSIPFVGGDITISHIGLIGNSSSPSAVGTSGTSVQSTGGQSANSNGQPGRASAGGGGANPAIVLHHTTRIGQRVIAEETVHYVAKRTSLGAAALAH